MPGMEERLRSLAMEDSSSSSSSSHGDDGINLPDVGVVGAESSSEGSPDFQPVNAPHLTAPTPSPQPPPRLESTSSDDVYLPEAPRRPVRDSPSSQQRRTHIKQFLMDSDDSSQSGSEEVDVPVLEESLDATKPPHHDEVPPTIATPPSSPSPPPAIDTSSHNEEEDVVSVSGESDHEVVEVSIVRPSPEPSAPISPPQPNEERKHLVSPVPVLSPPFSPTNERRSIPAPQPSPPRMPIRSAAFPNPKAVRVETHLIATPTTATPVNRASSSSGSRPKVKLIVHPRPASTVVRRTVSALPSTLEVPDGPPVKLTKSVQLRRSAANRLEGEWAAAQEGRPPPLLPVQPMFSAPERTASIYEVSLVSQRRKEERMEDQRRRCEATEGQHCTFAPTLSEGSEWLIKGMSTRRSVREPSGPPARGPPPFYSSSDKDDAVNCTFVPTVTAASRRILEVYDQELRREGKEPLPASERLYRDKERRDRVLAEEAQRQQDEREREEESVMKPLVPLSGAEEQALVNRVTHPHARTSTHRKEVMTSPVRESVVLPEYQVRAAVSRLSSGTGAPVNRHRQSKDAPAPIVRAPEVSGVSRLMRDAQRDRVVGSWYELLFPPTGDDGDDDTSIATRPIHSSISVLADAYPDLWDLVRTLGIYYQPDDTTTGVNTSASRALDFDTSVQQVGEQCWSREGFIATILHEEREHGPQVWTHQAPSQQLRALSADPTLAQKKAPTANPAVFKRLSRDASIKAAMRAPVVARAKPSHSKPTTTPTKKGGRAVDISSILATPGTSIVGRGGAPPQPQPLDTRSLPTPNHQDTSRLVSAAMELEALLMGEDPSVHPVGSHDGGNNLLRQPEQQQHHVIMSTEEGGSPGAAAHRAPTEAPENDADPSPFTNPEGDAFGCEEAVVDDECPMHEGSGTPSPHNQSLSFQDPDPLPASTPPKPTPPTSEGGVLLTLADATYHHGVVHRPDAENEAPLPITHLPRHGSKAPLAELVLGAHDLHTIQRLAQRLAAKQMATGAPHRKGTKLRITAHSTPAEF